MRPQGGIDTWGPLFGIAGTLDLPRLRANVPRFFPATLCVNPPDSLVDQVIASGDTSLLTVLAGSREVAERRPDVVDHVAARVPPQVLWKAHLGSRHLEYRHWEAILRRATPDDLPTPPSSWSDDPWRKYESGEWDDAGRSALVHSPKPGHCRYRLEHGPEPTPREQVHALAGIHREDGPVAAQAAIDRFRPSEGARFTAAMERPDGITALLAEVDDTATAIAAFRAEGDDADAARRHTRERADLDWGQVAAAHAAERLPGPVAVGLAARGDCPEELLLTFYAEQPVAVAEVCPRPPVSLFGIDAAGVGGLTRHFLALGRVEDLAAHGAPAVKVLCEVWHDRRLTPAHAVVGGILAETVGEDPGAWRTLRRLLNDHRGTVRELCETAASAPDPEGSWPDAALLDDDYDPHRALPDARRAFVVLFDAAPTSTQAALFPHLDQLTVADLVTTGVWRRTWVERLIERGTPEDSHAESHRWFMPEILAELRARFPTGGRYERHRRLLKDNRAHGLPAWSPFDGKHEELDAGTGFAECVGDEGGIGRHHWIHEALETGRVTWAEVIDHCRGAGATLELMSLAHPSQYMPSLRRILDESPLTTEAVVVALHLLYDNHFPGTLPELIAVASAATRETP